MNIKKLLMGIAGSAMFLFVNAQTWNAQTLASGITGMYLSPITSNFAIGTLSQYYTKFILEADDNSPIALRINTRDGDNALTVHENGGLLLGDTGIGSGVSYGWIRMSGGIYLGTALSTSQIGLYVNSKSQFYGNVGIGTAPSSTYALNVKGKIYCENEIRVAELNSIKINTEELNAKDVKVEMNNVADYVFEENYDLKSLSEIERFIRINKHLPGVPSGRELETKGVSISEMSNLLLEKIEELTLYMIQLEKENKALKVKVESLSK